MTKHRKLPPAFDVVGMAGFVFFEIGIGLWSIPAMLAVGGTLLMVWAVFAGSGGKPKGFRSGEPSA